MRKLTVILAAIALAAAGATQAASPVTINNAANTSSAAVTNGALSVTAGSGASAQQVQGTAASGSATVGSPVLVAGTDGTNARTFRASTGGYLQLNTETTGGAAATAGSPIQLVGGFDGGTNARILKTDTNGTALAGRIMPGTPITAASGNVANASAVATLSGAASKTTYIQGFQCQAAGATAAAVVNLTVAGVITGTMTYTFVFPAGATVAATPLLVNFAAPVPASATNTAIVVTLPAGGSGSTHASCNAQGFQL